MVPWDIPFDVCSKKTIITIPAKQNKPFTYHFSQFNQCLECFNIPPRLVERLLTISTGSIDISPATVTGIDPCPR